MINMYENPNGIISYNSPMGIILSYAVDGKTNVEICFNSQKAMLNQLKVNSIDKITVYLLLNCIYASDSNTIASNKYLQKKNEKKKAV